MESGERTWIRSAWANMSMTPKTRGSAIAEEPRDALRHLKYYGRFLTELLTRVLLGSGSGKIPRENGGSGKNDHPLSRGSVGSGTVCCGNPAGPGVKGVLLPRERESPRFPSRPIVTAVRLMFTIITVFVMLPILGKLSTIF